MENDVRSRLLLSLMIGAVICASVSARQDVAGAATGFTFLSPEKPVKENNFLAGSGDVLFTSAAMPDGRVLVVSTFHDEAKDKFLFRSYIIDSAGGVVGPKTIHSTSYPAYSVATALWIDADGEAGAEAGHFQLFIATLFSVTDQYDVRLKTLSLDSEGAPLGAAVELAHFEPQPTMILSYPSVVATYEGDSILVVYAHTHRIPQVGPRISEIFALETDHNGMALHEPQPIAAPDGGNYQIFKLETPFRHAKGWFVPTITDLHTYKPGPPTERIDRFGQAVHLLNITRSEGGLKGKARKVYQENVYLNQIVMASLVPPTPGAAASATAPYSLIYAVSKPNAAFYGTLTPHPLPIYHQAIGKKGSAKGQPTEIAVPPHKHSIKKFDSSMYWVSENRGDISKVMRNAAGDAVIALYRGQFLMRKTDQNERKYDASLGVYRLDLEQMKATPTQYAKAKKLPAGGFEKISLLSAGGLMTGISEFWELSTTSLRLFAVN